MTRQIAEDMPRMKLDLNEFAKDGLRTLVLGQKVLSQSDFDEWKMGYHRASIVQGDRDAEIEHQANIMEQDLELVRRGEGGGGGEGGVGGREGGGG